MLPPAKRFKMENRCGDTNGFQISMNGLQKTQTDENCKKEDTAAPVSTTAPLKEPQSQPPPAVQPMETESSSSGQKNPLVLPGLMADSSGGELSELSQDEGVWVAVVDVAQQMQELEQALERSEPTKATQSQGAKETQQEGGGGGGGGGVRQAQEQASPQVQQPPPPLSSQGTVTTNVVTSTASTTRATVTAQGGTGATENVQALPATETAGTQKGGSVDASVAGVQDR
ncbi:uncharacterized protein LOC134435391 [Engraulis encrasicolus]|uniref:uncharacterized protein LOC134435391 n=1 Tax=Engraulis encrasicolus TaxID=184585 RepID=UPI002FD77DD6